MVWERENVKSEVLVLESKELSCGREIIFCIILRSKLGPVREIQERSLFLIVN